MVFFFFPQEAAECISYTVRSDPYGMMETSGSCVRPHLQADVLATHCFGSQHCSQTGRRVWPAPSSGSVGDNSHNYSGKLRPRKGNWRWDTVLVLLWQVIRYDSVYLTCSKKLTGSQLSTPHGTNKKL